MRGLDSADRSRPTRRGRVRASLGRALLPLMGSLVLAACGGGEPGGKLVPPPEPAPLPRVVVSIPDANLRAAIEGRLEKESGATIYVDEMETIIDFASRSREIEDLRGLESARRLRRLDLSRNDVSDLTPLSDLTSLEELYLWAQESTTSRT